MGAVQFFYGSTVPTTSNLPTGGLYFNTSNNKIYLNSGSSITIYDGTDLESAISEALNAKY